MLVRIVKRRAAWEEDDPAAIADVEFRDSEGGDDLRPSVYEVGDRDGCLRCMAEHGASFLRPVAPKLGIDVSDPPVGSVHVDPGRTFFAFANAQHREVVLADRAELLAFVEHAMPRERVTFTNAEVKAYVRAQRDAGHAEWEAAFKSAPHGSKWKSA